MARPLLWLLLATVGCSGSEPRVVTFTASAGDVYQGESVDIAWSVVDAESVDVSMNGMALGSGTSGSTRSPGLDENAVFRLVATRGDDTIVRTIEVRVQPLDDPAVAAFSVGHRAVTERTTTTARWVTQRATSVDLLLNGAVVHESAVVPEGQFEITIEGRDEMVLVAKRGSRTARARLIIDAATVETEPNEGDVQAVPISEDGAVIGETRPGDLDVFSLGIGRRGEFVEAEVTRLDGTCDGLFLELRSNNTDPPLVYSADFVDGCPRIDPDRMWRAIGGLPRTTLRLYLWSTEATEYVLRARWVPPECKNGRVEVYAGEGCDGDEGCDDTTCRMPGTVDEVDNSRSNPQQLVADEGVVMVVASPNDRTHDFSIDVPAGADLVLTNRSEGSSHACIGPAVFEFEPDVGRTEVLATRDAYGCERRVLLADDVARTVHIRLIVERPSQIEWRVAPAACGNGVRQTGEACDGEPGCTTTCTFDSSDTLPSEGSVILTGTLQAGGVYGVPLTLTSTSHLIASISDIADGRCQASNPRLRLDRADGALVAAEEHLGPGLCPVLDARVSRLVANLPPGAYFLVAGDAEATFDFEIEVKVGQPACGDGVLDVGETCDDGDTSPGDGCDGACSIEPVALEPMAGARIDEVFQLDGVSSFRAFTADVIPGTDIIADSLTPRGSCFSPTQIAISTDGVDARSFPSTCRGAKLTATATGAVSIGFHRRAFGRDHHYAGVSVIHPQCGDGYVSSYSEACDDSDADAGDGCTACRFDPGLLVEVEPNETRQTAMVLTATATHTRFVVAGTLSGDPDVYVIDVSALPVVGLITATTFSDLGNVDSCTVDTRLALAANDGFVFLENDDYRNRTCSRLSLPGFGSDEYWLIVDGDPAGFYLMEIEVEQ